MSNEALLIYKLAGLSEESTWAQGTITPATKLLPLRESGVVIGIAPNLLQPVRVTGRAGLGETILGTTSPSMTAAIFGYPVGIGLKLLKVALGQVTSTEQASFVVSATNKKIDLKEDGGTELTAVIDEGTYPAGATSAVAGSLCAKLKAALEVAGAGTYTVSYSFTTKLFTISVAGGVVSAFQLLFSTGTNAATSARSLLGFASADTTSQASHVAGTATEVVFSHAITILDALTYGRSAGLTVQAKVADEKVFDILDAVVNSLKIAYAPNQELHFDADMQARKVDASVATLASLTAPSVKPLLYSQAAFTLNSVTKSLAGLDISFNNNLKTDLFANSRYRTKFVRGGLRSVTGTLKFDITDADTFALFDAFNLDSAGVPLIATFTGPVIKGALTYSIAMNMPLVKWNFDQIPGGGGVDAPAGEVPFIALDNGSTGELSITVQNNEPSI